MQAKIDGAPLPLWSSVNVAAGTTLEFGYALQGCRTYLAVSGGISVPLVMGSRSTYAKAQIGGLHGRALAKDDVIAIGEDAARNAIIRILPQKYRPTCSENIELRAIIGPQDDAFSDKAIQAFFESEYTVAGDADRMGYRLEGAAIEHKDKADIVSDALCRGAVQVPGNGQPIIMMVDCGTTGGYTKIATVIGPDLSLLAQAKPGDHIRFKRVDDSAAVTALVKEMELYGRLPAELSSVEIAANQVPAQTRRMSIKIGQEIFEVEICEEL